MTTRARLLYGVFFLSGIAGLGYQMVWSRMFAVGLGHELLSVLALYLGDKAQLGCGRWGCRIRIQEFSGLPLGGFAAYR